MLLMGIRGKSFIYLTAIIVGSYPRKAMGVMKFIRKRARGTKAVWQKLYHVRLIYSLSYKNHFSLITTFTAIRERLSEKCARDNPEGNRI